MSDFKVQGKLGLDGAGFFSTLNSAKSAVNSFGGMLAGAFSVGAIAAFSKSVIDLASSLNDVSDALAINVEYLQKFLNSARQSGGDLGDIEKFIFKANQSRQAAVNNPTGPEAGAFQRMGFSSSDISSATAQQMMDKIISAFASGATPQKLNDLSEIGGKSAKKLVGGFKEGLDQSTGIMSEELVIQLDTMGDKFQTLATTLKTILAPAINYILSQLNEMAGGHSRVDALTRKAMANYKSGMPLLASILKGREDLNAEDDAKEAKERKRLADIRAGRKTSESTPANFVSQIKPAATTAEKSYSDSLLAVGNFLGSGKASSLQSIAQKHLDIATQHLAVSRSILSAVGSTSGNLIVGI